MLLPVVAVMEADDGLSAQDALRAELASAGFDVYEHGQRDVFESECSPGPEGGKTVNNAFELTTDQEKLAACPGHGQPDAGRMGPQDTAQ